MRRSYSKILLGMLFASCLIPNEGFAAIETRNIDSGNLMNVPAVWTDPYNLNGKDVKIAVVDGGQVRSTHQEFMDGQLSRVVIMGSNEDLSDHATHVAGTIGAKGVEYNAHGMANASRIYSYYFNDTYFADSLLRVYNDSGVLLSNHSYGYSGIVNVGKYDVEASSMDSAVYSNPYINTFMAAGNDGLNTDYSDYGIIKGPGNAKNILTIGALSADGSRIDVYSSTGPVFDGRVKPDLCAKGSYTYSTGAGADDEYIYKTGTSMATPAATGAAALVVEQYKSVTGNDMRHYILKSVLINSAHDIGRPGPDYESGFGLIDVKGAVDLVKNGNTQIITDQVVYGEEKSIDFTLALAQAIKVTISWIDLPANPSGAKTLVNDLDIWIEDTLTGKKYYPYSLNRNNPAADASAFTFNRVDNVEQIEAMLPEGSYQLKVKGYLIVSDEQEYAIAHNIPLSHNGIERSIINLYEVVLDRTENQIGDEEIAYWAGKILAGESVLSVINGFIYSEEFMNKEMNDEEFITKMYQIFLDREPDTGGLNYWLDVITNRGSSRKLLVYEFAFSQEFSNKCDTVSATPYSREEELKGFIERLYRYVLTRDADGGGIAYWVNELYSERKNGLDLVKSFFASTEFRSNTSMSSDEFIVMTYRSILGREPGQSEIDYWKGKLAVTSQEYIINAFLASAEFQQLSDKYGIKAF